MTKDKIEKNNHCRISEILAKANYKRKVFSFVVVMLVLVSIVLSVKTVVFDDKKGQVTTISKATLEEVLEISELSTISYIYNGIATVFEEEKEEKEDEKKIKYYVAYEGTVSAGIDFEKIEIELNDEKKIVTIKLPDVEIHNAEVNMATLDCIFMDEKYNVSKVSQEAYSKSEEDLKERVKKEEDLLNIAKENAIASIKALFEPWIEQLDKEYVVQVY